MAKLVMIFFAVVAIIQIIKPLGWPGLKYRRDAWKLVAVGIFAIIAMIGLRPEGDVPAPADETRQTPPTEQAQ